MSTASPPVNPFLRLIDYREYLHTPGVWIALCVVENNGSRDLKLYKWRRDSPADRWRVALANFSIMRVDLQQLAADAICLAEKYGIELKQEKVPTSSDADIQAAIDALTQKLETPAAHRRPPCPICGHNQVLPILYGAYAEGRGIPGVDFIYGGPSFTVESPVWHCTVDEHEWGRFGLSSES